MRPDWKIIRWLCDARVPKEKSQYIAKLPLVDATNFDIYKFSKSGLDLEQQQFLISHIPFLGALYAFKGANGAVCDVYVEDIGNDEIEVGVMCAGAAAGLVQLNLINNTCHRVADASQLVESEVIYWALLFVLAAVHLSGAYVVEVSPKETTAKQRKTAEKKPWLAAPKRHLILMDKPTAKANGHAGGSHASPCRHQRRGHWNTLRHEKFRRNEDGSHRRVWVKPAWVGEREWEHQGNIYRVVNIGAAE